MRIYHAIARNPGNLEAIAAELADVRVRIPTYDRRSMFGVPLDERRLVLVARVG